MGWMLLRYSIVWKVCPYRSPVHTYTHIHIHTHTSLYMLILILSHAVNSVSFPRAHADDLDKDAVISVSFERGTNSIATYDRTVSTLRNSDIGVVFLESLSLVVTMYKHVASNSYQVFDHLLCVHNYQAYHAG